MGCIPSRSQETQGSATDDPSETRTGCSSTEDSKRTQNNTNSNTTKTNLKTTIQMVNDETLKLLQEIGELKDFETAKTDCKKNLAVHHDIMLALENPKSRNPTTPSSNSQTTTPSNNEQGETNVK